MGIANLGGIQFRLDPNSITYDYSIDYSVIDTLGGRVIQVLGSTIGDITITGEFGQDHKNKQLSWQLAESFGAQIRALMDQQVVPPKQAATGGVHAPIRFTYLDGTHNWDMQVLIKAYQDASGNGSIEHTTAKMSYGYQLTLFLVQDASMALSRVQADKFIARISRGIGWKENSYKGASGTFSGAGSIASAISFIQANSADGTFDGYLAAIASGALPVEPKTSGSSVAAPSPSRKQGTAQ